MIKQALVHRYDDIRDIIAVKEFECSEVYRNSVKGWKFDILIVIPTLPLNCNLAVFGENLSGQYPPEVSCDWPGRQGPYKFRVDIGNPRFTTVDCVKDSLIDGRLWSTSLTVFPVTIDDALLREIVSHEAALTPMQILMTL